MIVGNSKATQKGKSTKASKTIKAPSVANTSSVESKEKTTMEVKKPNLRADGA